MPATLRTAAFWAAVAAFVFAAATAAPSPKRSMTPVRPIPKSRSVTSCPTAVPPPPMASSARPKKPISRWSTKTAASTGARSSSSPMTTPTARRRPSNRCASSSRATRCWWYSMPLGTPSNSAIQKYLNAKKVPQLFVATGATKWNDPKHFPWTIGWQPSYQSEALHLREIPDEGKAGRQDRRALPERRFRQGLPQGPEGRLRRQGIDDRCRGKLRDLGADDRQPYRQAQGQRRRRPHQHHDAEIRGADDQEDGRDRLEGAADRLQRLDFGRQRDQAGGLRERARHPFGRLRQGRSRSAMERRSRDEEVSRPARQVLSGSRPPQQPRWSMAMARHRP